MAFLTDADLVEACIKREEGAWNLFLERYSSLILTVIRRTLRAKNVAFTSEDAEDICENTFYELLRKDFHLLRSYNPRFMLSTWLGIIARTQANRFLRKQRSCVVAGAGPDTTRLLAQIAATESGDAAGKELKEILRKAWEDLPDKERSAVKLFYFGGRNYREIARTLKLSPNSIGSMLFRARMKLKGRLKNIEEFLH